MKLLQRSQQIAKFAYYITIEQNDLLDEFPNVLEEFHKSIDLEVENIGTDSDDPTAIHFKVRGKSLNNQKVSDYVLTQKIIQLPRFLSSRGFKVLFTESAEYDE